MLLCYSSPSGDQAILHAFFLQIAFQSLISSSSQALSAFLFILNCVHQQYTHTDWLAQWLRHSWTLSSILFMNVYKNDMWSLASEPIHTEREHVQVIGDIWRIPKYHF